MPLFRERIFTQKLSTPSRIYAAHNENLLCVHDVVVLSHDRLLRGPSSLSWKFKIYMIKTYIYMYKVFRYTQKPVHTQKKHTAATEKACMCINNWKLCRAHSIYFWIICKMCTPHTVMNIKPSQTYARASENRTK